MALSQTQSTATKAIKVPAERLPSLPAWADELGDFDDEDDDDVFFFFCLGFAAADDVAAAAAVAVAALVALLLDAAADSVLLDTAHACASRPSSSEGVEPVLLARPEVAVAVGAAVAAVAATPSAAAGGAEAPTAVRCLLKSSKAPAHRRTHTYTQWHTTHQKVGEGQRYQ